MSKEKNSPLSFETELQKLEEIVQKLEGGEIPLSDLVTLYEAGSKRLATCNELLKDAEFRIEQLKKVSDKEISTAPFEEKSDD